MDGKIGSDLNNHLIAIRVSQEDVIHAERLKVREERREGFKNDPKGELRRRRLAAQL